MSLVHLVGGRTLFLNAFRLDLHSIIRLFRPPVVPTVAVGHAQWHFSAVLVALIRQSVHFGAVLYLQ